MVRPGPKYRANQPCSPDINPKIGQSPELKEVGEVFENTSPICFVDPYLAFSFVTIFKNSCCQGCSTP
jgi:hypothetical protein